MSWRVPPARSALLALLALLLAGCAGTGDEGGAGATPRGGTGAQPIPFARTDLGAGGPEPVVAVADDGYVYVGAQDARGGGPRVWVSADGGKTFSMKRPTTQGGGEVDLAAGPRGAVYLTQLGARGNLVSVSHDHGETWTTAPLGPQTQYFDREWLAVDAQGRVYALARQFGQAAAAGVSRSDDGGLTWLPQGYAWDAAREPGLANGNLVAAKGALFLPYICRDGQGVCVATSRDAAVTWTQSLVAERTGATDNVYPTLAVSSAGVLVAWSDATDGRLAVYTASSPDGRAGWTSPARVSPAGTTASLGWVTARGDEAWVVYLTTAARLSLTDEAGAEDASWYPVAVPLDARGANPGPEVRVADQPVHQGVISKPIGGSRVRDRNFGDFFTAALDAEGKLLVAVSMDQGSPESTRDLVFVER
jgi:hypothetical protein